MKTFLQKSIFVSFLTLICLGFSQYGLAQIQPTMAVRGTINTFGNNAMTYRSSLSQTWIATVQATTTNASAAFLFANNGSFSPKWARGAAVTFNSQTTWFANGADGTYSQVNGNFYTFICQDQNGGTNSKGYVFQTSATPVSISTIVQSPLAANVATGNAVTVTATTSATLPTGQGVFLRYSTDGFANSTILNMTGSGSTYSAIIPSATNTLGANVVYYVFTSGGTTPMATADADLSTININNNSGSNYSYTVSAPSTYTWNQTGTASWATPGNWTPSRTTPNTADILLFNNGATTTTTNIPVQTIGSLSVSANTTVNLQPAAAGALTIGNGVAGADLSVASGSALNANGANALALTVGTGATASISGNMSFSTSANTFLGTDASAITFNSGANFTQNTGNTGAVFGSTGTANVVIFGSGSMFNQITGSSPFGLTQPASKVTFQTGSLFKLSVAQAPGLAGRIYANFEYDAAGIASGTGGTAYSIDNLTVTQGTLNLNVTVASSIKGNISVASGATLTFSPGSVATVNLNGLSVQSITNAGTLTVATNANLTVVSGSTVDLGTSIITGAGTFTAASGSTLRTGNTNGLASSGATGSVQTTTRTLNAGANYVYNGTANQITGTGLPATVNTLTINNTGTSPTNVVTLTAITTITATTNSLTLTAGKLDLNAKQLVIPNNGNIVATTGDFTTTPGPLYFIGAGTVSGTVNFPTVRLSGGVNFGSSSNIITSMLMESGSFVNTNAPTYGNTSTLIYNTGGTYGRNLEWSATSGMGYPNHVQIQNGTTVDLSANGFANRAIAGNLNLGLNGVASAGSLSMGATTNKLTIGGNLVIGGNTSGTSTLNLSTAVGGDIYLTGNWDTKTNGVSVSNTRAVFFEGAGTSTVTTIGSASFDYLFINKTSGGTVSLANDMTVNNNLTLNAQLVTNAFKVIIPTGNNVSANANGWVRGNLQKNIPTGTNSRTFEIGDATIYTPVITAYTGVTGAGNIVVTTTINDHPQIGTSNIIASKSVNRYYNIANNGVTGGSYDATFTFVAGDLDGGTLTSALGVSNYVNPTWTNLTVGTRTSTTTQAIGVSLYGDFQLGETVATWTGGASTSAWLTSGNWSHGVPTSTTNVIIPTASYYPEITSNVTINSLLLDSGTTLKVIAANNLTVTGAIQNDGTLTIENTANLKQVNDVSNSGSGTAIVRRTTATLMRQDYVLWSSPVTGQQLQSFSPATLSNRFYTYDPSSDNYVAETATNDFITGKGYLIRMPNNHPVSPTVWNGQFVGTNFNNGTVPINFLTANTYNAIGNPYPSSIDADLFIAGNTLTDAMYFWRKSNNSANPSYATYTLAGGIGTAGSGDPLGLVPNGEIQAGQGFIVKTGATTSLQFTNTMRTTDNGGLFFRASELERNRIWLNISNTTGIFSQTLISYMENATSGFDNTIDGRFFNDSQNALTSIINNEEYAIQGRALPFDATDVVALGFKSELPGEYSIAIDHVDGFFTANEDIFLRDNVANMAHDLRIAPYTFTTEAGVFNSRFELLYQNPLGVGNPTFDANQVVIYKNATNDFVINSGNVTMATVKVFDIRGRLLVERKAINATQTTIQVGLSNEVLLVQITSEDGILVTKKVVR